MRFSLLLSFLILLLARQGVAQNEVRDSLANRIKIAKNDTARMAAQMDYLDFLDNDDEWVELNAAIQNECKSKIPNEKGKRQIFFKEKYAITLSNEAFMRSRLGEKEKSHALNEQALKIFLEIGQEAAAAKMYNNIGFSYNRAGNVPKALESYTKALQMHRKFKQTDDIARTLLNLSAIAYNQNQYQEALVYLLEAEEIVRDSKDEKLKSRCYLNLSANYRATHEHEKMFSYLNRAVAILERTGDREGLGYAYNNLATNYRELKQFNVAKYWAQKGLAIRRDTKDKKSIASSLTNYASILIAENKTDSVKAMLDEAYELSTFLKSPELLQDNHEQYFKFYESQKNDQLALDHYKKFIIYRDSLQNDKNKKLSLRQTMQVEYERKEAMLLLEQEKLNIENREKLRRQQLQYDFERRQRETQFREIALQEELRRKQLMFENKSEQARLKAESDRKQLSLQEDIKRRELENRNQRTLTYFFIIGFVLMGALAFFIFRGLQQNKKAKKIIELQKEKVEQQNDYIREKQKEIVDSITYAKRLQEAILPPENLLKQHLPQHFVYYKPKDIVAGDFYWLGSTRDAVLVAAADCTGHGVPGAMVSLVCSNALNRTVKEFGIHDPGKLLDKVRELVIETFEKSESEVKDGMDISFLSIRKTGAETTLEWAGANNPLWILRNDGTMEVLKPDKQPIGRSDDPYPFRTHVVTASPGDTVYLFTDGFADQFGGSKGKKFKYKQLQDLLAQHVHLPMNEQKKLLDAALESWRGNLEQVDDILVMGIRIT